MFSCLHPRSEDSLLAEFATPLPAPRGQQSRWGQRSVDAGLLSCNFFHLRFSRNLHHTGLVPKEAVMPDAVPHRSLVTLAVAPTLALGLHNNCRHCMPPSHQLGLEFGAT